MAQVYFFMKHSLVELTEKFIPLLTQNGKIITIGSKVGKTSYLKSDDLVKRFKNPNITREDVFKLAEEFQQHVSNSIDGFNYYFFNSNQQYLQIILVILFFKNIIISDLYNQKKTKYTYEQNGWPSWGYAISKLLINTYVKTLAQNVEVKNRNLQVYSDNKYNYYLYACCPGWVKTDMGGQQAELTIDQGALTPVYLVELPHEVNPDYQGQFFHLQKVEEL